MCVYRLPLPYCTLAAWLLALTRFVPSYLLTITRRQSLYMALQNFFLVMKSLTCIASDQVCLERNSPIFFILFITSINVIDTSHHVIKMHIFPMLILVTWVTYCLLWLTRLAFNSSLQMFLQFQPSFAGCLARSLTSFSNPTIRKNKDRNVQPLKVQGIKKKKHFFIFVH